MLDALEATLAPATDSSSGPIEDAVSCLLVEDGAIGCTLLGLGISFGGGVQRLVAARGLGEAEGGGVLALFFSNMAIRAAMPPCFPLTPRSDGVLAAEDDGLVGIGSELP